MCLSQILAMNLKIKLIKLAIYNTLQFYFPPHHFTPLVTSA